VRASANRPQRLLQLSWEFPPRIVGGIARHVSELSLALAQAGLEVDVLTAYHPEAPREEEITAGSGQPAGRLAGRVKVLRAGPSPIHPLDFVCEIHQLDFGLLERLLAYGAQEYDLIHAHDWLVAFAARTLKHGLGAPLVATMHATEMGRNYGLHNPMQHYIHSVEWMLTYDAWRVICCSQAMAGEVQGALKVPTDKVRVVPNGVDPERLHSGDSPAELAKFRARWARPEERILLFVGRLVREKGVEVLLDAMPQVLAAHPEAKLVVVGSGEHGPLRGRAAEKGLGEKILFAGFVPEEELRRLYAVANLAVFPSLYEPFGIVALEAMAAGVPVVTSDIGGFQEVVRHGETGLHTWANNPHSLAWGITRVLSDSRLAERLRRAGRREVRQRYAWEKIAEHTLTVYREVLAEREAAAAPRPVLAMEPGPRPRYLAAEPGRRS